jgi:flagellar hook-length control protein FliK
MSETQNNTVVAAFLTATGNAGLMTNKRVEIGGSSAEIDFGKFLKAATQVTDSKERYCQADKPDYREPGRPSTPSEPSPKTNHALAQSKSDAKDYDGADYQKKPVESKTPALDHAVKTSDSQTVSAPHAGTADAEMETQTADGDASVGENQLPDEIQAELVLIMNQLSQLLALLNPQVSGTNETIDLTGLNGVDAAKLQSLLNQLQLMLNSQPGTASSLNSNGPGASGEAIQSVATTNQSANAAAVELLNQITAQMQSGSFNNNPGFQQLLGEMADSLKNFAAGEPKSQTAQTIQTKSLQPGSDAIAAQQKPAVNLTAEIVEMGQAETEAEGNPSQTQIEIHPQSQISAAHLAKGAWGEGKPLNLAVIQTQLIVGEGQNESGTTVAVAPLQNQNSPLVGHTQQFAGHEAAAVNRDELFSQIVERAKFMFSNNHSEMEVNLKPDHLGKLQLKVTVENQVITARFVAESQQVKEIIETNLNQLRDQLRQNGMQVDALTVAVGNQMNPQNFNQTGDNQNGANYLGGQSQGFNTFNETNEESPMPSPQAIRDTVIDLIA